MTATHASHPKSSQALTAWHRCFPPSFPSPGQHPPPPAGEHTVHSTQCNISPHDHSSSTVTASLAMLQHCQPGGKIYPPPHPCQV